MKMEIQEININKIRINPSNPRKEFDKDSLEELSASIKSRGLINPISVKRIDGTDEFELICGERRLKAHKLVNKKTIPAIIKEYNSKEDEMTDSLIENLHRADLSSIEKENFITKLWETGKYKTYRELGKTIGLNEGQIKVNINAKVLREKTNPGKVSTRDLRDVQIAKDLEDKKQILKKVVKGELNSNDIVKTARIINKSPTEVKQAFFSDKISIEQADKISNIKDEKIRKKMITAHKNIKSIDKSIERNFEKIKPKTEKQTIRIKEAIDDFRSNAIFTQKSIQGTMKSLLKIIPMINLMDGKQLKQLEHFQDLFETNISNALQLSENLKDKIKN